jgi:uncharacterized BrkB/YihY/UPF0761 family membrane protein
MGPGAGLLSQGERKKMELINMEIVKNGLIAGAAVAVISAVLIMLFSGYLFQQAKDLGETVQSVTSTALSWIGRWTVISLVFGIVCTAGFAFVSSHWSWGFSQVLLLAIVSAVVLTVLAYMPLYGVSKFAPYANIYSALNFIYALGFGYLVPKLAGVI